MRRIQDRIARKKIGSVIRHNRDERNILQAELAEKVGVTRTFISLVENQKRIPSLWCVEKIADCFGKTATELILEATKIGYYPNIVKAIRDILQRKYANTEPKEGLNNLPSHLLWMLERIEEIDDDPGKAGRWIGYIIRAVEELGLLTNQQSREIIRKDVSY